MNKYKISGNGRTYERINKATARKLYNNGVSIAICPVKMHPCNMWAPAFITRPESFKESSFDSFVNSFIYYNCQYNETGKYPAFYTVTNN